MTDENIFSENSEENDSKRDEKGRTTADMQQEAAEALKLYNTLKSGDTVRDKKQTGLFDASSMLAVNIQGSDNPLLLTAKSEYIIGRRDPATGHSPDIDLSKHGAYQLGISRKHAVIKWEDDQLFLFDMGSRNGTYINGKRAIPEQPFKLYDGDEIRLGKMRLKIAYTKKDA